MLEMITTVGDVGLPIAAAGLMLWLVWYAVTKMFPKIQKDFSDTIGLQRQDFTESLLEQRTTFRESLDTQAETHFMAQKELRTHVEDIKDLVKSTNSLIIAHDLTVRGTNDSIVGTTRDVIASANIDSDTLESALRIVRRRGE